MPVLESSDFETVTASDLTVGTDLLYVRRSSFIAGARDAKFAITAMFKSFLSLTVAANKLVYSSAENVFATSDITALARSLLARATAPLMRVDLGIITGTGTLNFASINAAASEDLTITVTGAAVGDSVHLGLPAAPTAGIVFQGFVSAANTVTVRATNITGSPVNPDSATYRATVIKTA